MTHDESVSYLWFCGIDVWSCFWDRDCWPSANNHLLNTYLFQLTTKWFGVSEYSIRLPNLVAHGLYLFTSLWLVWTAGKQWWQVLLGFIVLNAQPYLLDFFSLARGYGLCVGLVMGSILSFIQFLRKGRRVAHFMTFLFGFAAVMANFTALNYWVSLWAGVLLTGVVRGPGEISWGKYLFRENLLPLLGSLVLVLLLYYPIQFLGAGGEFGYGASSLGGTFRSIVECSLYEAGYFGDDTTIVFNILYLCFLFGAIPGAFVLLYWNRGEIWRQEYFFVAILFLMSCLVMLAQHWLLGSNFLIDRKALLFVPLSGLLLFYSLLVLNRYSWSRYLGGLLILFGGWHFFRTSNLSYFQEWKYDKDTKRMVQLLDSRTPVGSAKFRLGLNWHFQPTATFYHWYFSIQSFHRPAFLPEIRLDERNEYYYLYEPELPKLEDQYRLVKDFGGGKLLLRKFDPD